MRNYWGMKASLKESSQPSRLAVTCQQHTCMDSSISGRKLTVVSIQHQQHIGSRLHHTTSGRKLMVVSKHKHVMSSTPGASLPHMCHGDREAMTFLYWKDRYTGCQGPLGPGYGPVNTTVCQSRDGKATAYNALPTVVAWDMTSYRTSGRWLMRLYVAAYVMTQRYKSGCALVPGSLFVSPADWST